MPKGTEMFRQSKEASTIFWPAKKVKYVSNTIQNQILDPRNKLPTDFRILLSSLSRYSQEPKWKRIFESLRVLFEKVLVFYSDWPESWNWRPWDMLRIFFVFKCHLHNASKVFLPKKFWIPCTVSKVPFVQNWKIAKMALSNSRMQFKILARLEGKIRKCLFFDGSLL